MFICPDCFSNNTKKDVLGRQPPQIETQVMNDDLQQETPDADVLEYEGKYVSFYGHRRFKIWKTKNRRVQDDEKDSFMEIGIEIEPHGSAAEKSSHLQRRELRMPSFLVERQ